MLRLTANAKINWTLTALGKRSDGYHELDMLMESVSLSDTLILESADDITLAGSPLKGEYERDLTYRAAMLLKSVSGFTGGARMTLEKRIPSGAGMGGGSADAAAVLIGLSRLWELDMPHARLCELGLRLGADVPFMLTGGLCRVRGIGESIERIEADRVYWLVILQPCEGLSTREIYARYDEAGEHDKACHITQVCACARATGDTASLITSMGNALEPVSARLRPAIEEAKRALTHAGALRAMMTGSGSAVYGVFENETQAKTARERLRGRYETLYTAHTERFGVSCEEI